MPGKIKNIFLDRDGTINEIIFRDSKATSPRSVEEFRLRDDFIRFHERAASLGKDLFIISNQPEIPRGLIDRGFLEQVDLMIRAACRIKDASYCLHDDGDGCDCRKPEPGMINRMIEKHALLKDETIMIGDTWKDVAAGKAAGVKTVMLRRDYNRQANCQPDHQVDQLMDLWATGIF
ncbi:MAG: HAD-IIIA family hydrolase [Candidatus Edwardsbacteria bacterium]|nr:HAD-IIIA family hydrolase [Candidatus Edwardsbacteria bacterium]